MNFSSIRKLLGYSCVAATALLALASISRAQQMSNQTAIGQSSNPMADSLYTGTVDLKASKEQATAFQAFSKEQEPNKKIQLGTGFLQKYPKSVYAEKVDVALMIAYDDQQDWNDTYRFGDNALALNPDNVDVLTTVGWTIPHVYDPNGPDADKELDKAEKYAKHAIDVLSKVTKPPNMTDAQFAETRTTRTFQAHSALGLVYFRRDDYDNSAKELQLATKDNPIPDQTDFFVLGADLQNTKRYSEAADAFSRCGQIAGALQDQCKQSAQMAQTQADHSKPK